MQETALSSLAPGCWAAACRMSKLTYFTYSLSYLIRTQVLLPALPGHLLPAPPARQPSRLHFRARDAGQRPYSHGPCFAGHGCAWSPAPSFPLTGLVDDLLPHLRWTGADADHGVRIDGWLGGLVNPLSDPCFDPADMAAWEHDNAEVQDKAPDGFLSDSMSDPCSD